MLIGVGAAVDTHVTSSREIRPAASENHMWLTMTQVVVCA
jgi:hypothetical protein